MMPVYHAVFGKQKNLYTLIYEAYVLGLGLFPNNISKIQISAYRSWS